MKSTLFNMVAVLFSVTLIASAGVGAVNMLTVDAIAEAKALATTEAVKNVLPAFDNTEDWEMEIDQMPVKIYKALSADAVVGYAVEAMSKNGFGGAIRVMVGFSTEGKILNVNVLEQKETPGLGANMTKAGNSLERSIVAKDPATLTFAVTKEGGSFDALTGSTISSRAYANAVETAYAGYLWATGRLNTEAQAESMTGGTIQSDSNLM